VSDQLRIVLLGPLRVERDGQPLPDSAWRSRQERRLLTALVLARGVALPLARLVEWLWPAADPERGAVTLRSSVSSLRATIGPGGPRASQRYILTQAGGYAWNMHSGAWVDVEQFLELAERPHDARQPIDLERAIALYRGDLLEDEPDMPWATALRERLRAVYLQAIEQVAELRLEQGAYAEAAALAWRGLERERLREPLYRVQMRTAALQGDIVTALQSYERFRLLLDHELGAAPAPATQALHTAILRGEVGGQPDAQTVRLRSQVRRNLEPALQGPAAPLVGREPELAQLRSWLSALGQSRGGTVTVVGEAGIGKTQLVSAALREAQARGCQVIALRCEAIERSQPFAALAEALRPLVRAAPAALLSRLPRAALAQAAELLPGLRERVPELPGLAALGAAETRTRVAEGLVELALALSHVAPLVLSCDDAQWADEALLATIGRLARTAPRQAVLIILAYRAEELSDNAALHALLRSLGREMLLRPLLIGPLDETQVAELLAAHGRVRPERVARLARLLTQRSAGNPLVLQVLLQSLLDMHGATSLATLLPALQEPVVLPDPSGAAEVRDMVGARLERLSLPVRTLAEQIALLGRSVSLDLVELLGGEQALLSAQELLDRRFVVESAAGRLDYAHELVRAATVAMIGGPRRRLLHRQIAAALDQLHGGRPERAAEIALHLSHAGRDANRDLLRYALLAADHATAHFGYHEARRFYELALSAAQQLGQSAPAQAVAQALEGMRRAEQALQSSGRASG
jgi:DNA-binding SARP family transcriptional activator